MRKPTKEEAELLGIVAVIIIAFLGIMGTVIYLMVQIAGQA